MGWRADFFAPTGMLYCSRRNAVQRRRAFPKTSGAAIPQHLIICQTGVGHTLPRPHPHTLLPSQRSGRRLAQTPPDTRSARRSLPVSWSPAVSAPRRLSRIVGDSGSGVTAASQCQSNGWRGARWRPWVVVDQGLDGWPCFLGCRRATDLPHAGRFGLEMLQRTVAEGTGTPNLSI